MEKFNDYILDRITISSLIENDDYSVNTKKTYYDLLKLFKNFIKQDFVPVSSCDEIKAYIKKFVEEKKKMNRKYSYLKSITKLLSKLFLQDCPFKMPKKNRSDANADEKLPETLSLSDVKKIIEFCENEIAQQNYLAGLMFIQTVTGMRFDELWHFQAKNLKELINDNVTKIISSKSITSRFTPIPKEVVTTLNKIWNNFYLLSNPESYIARSNPNRDSFKRKFNNYCIDTSLRLFGLERERCFTSHSLRRAYAQSVYQKTKDLPLVMNLMGHKNIVTTSRYLRLDRDTLKAKVNGLYENVV